MGRVAGLAWRGRAGLFVTVAVSAFAAAVYAAVVMGGGAVVKAATYAPPNNATTGPTTGLLVVAATLLVGVSFGAVGRRARYLATWLVYGKRATPYEALRRFTTGLAAYPRDSGPAQWARLIEAATDARVRVWLAVAGEAEPPNADLVVPVHREGELLGAFLVDGGRPTRVEERLLTDLAAHAGLVLRNARLAAALQARLELLALQAVELSAARTRIASTADAERRRLEQDLRLTVTPHLTALAAGVDELRLAALGDPATVPAHLPELRARADIAIETVRGLASGAFPPLLRDQGPAAALRTYAARNAHPAVVRAKDLGRYPTLDEAPIYFCCLETIRPFPPA